VASASYHVLLACRSKDKAEKALSDIKASVPKGSVSYLPLDITDQSSIDSAYELVVAQFNRLDIIINNAGILVTEGKLAEQMRQTFWTNTASQAAVTETFRPLLKKII
jgi:NAD(P)-dependent dehydrogenase (short-subunit alcohol dehydrogenase family)